MYAHDTVSFLINHDFARKLVSACVCECVYVCMCAHAHACVCESTFEGINALSIVVVYMGHRKMEFDTCEQIAITLSSLA